MTHLWSLYQRAIIKQGKQLKCHTGQHTILCESKINQSINQSYNKGRCSPGWWMGCSLDQYWPGISTKNTWCKCGPCQHTIIHKAYIGGDFHTNIINTDVVQAVNVMPVAPVLAEYSHTKYQIYIWCRPTKSMPVESVSAETYIPNIIDADMVQAGECDACSTSIGRICLQKNMGCKYGTGRQRECLWSQYRPRHSYQI